MPTNRIIKNSSKLVIFWLAVCSIYTSKAQQEFSFQGGNSDFSGFGSGFQLGVNANVIFPTGILGNEFRSGLGIGVTGKYLIDDLAAVGAIVNYDLMSFRGGNIVGVTVSLLQYGGTLDYYFQPGSSPYLSIDLSNYSLNYRVSNATVGQPGFSTGFGQSAFGMAPALGYVVKMADNWGLNVSFKYHYLFGSLTTNISQRTQFVQISAGAFLHFGGK